MSKVRSALFLSLLSFILVRAVMSGPLPILDSITTRTAVTPIIKDMPADGATFFVALDGSPTGEGTQTNPWDLQTALDHPEQVSPGDIIWLRGGTYRGTFQSFLNGTPNAPIIVRSYPGEWAVIDTEATSAEPLAFRVSGSWTYYWDFELTNTRTSDRGGGFHMAVPNAGNKAINLFIHDMPQSNFVRDGNEVYGSIFYNNGRDDDYQHHHLYVANSDAQNPVRIVDSILFNSYAFGIHAYSSGVGLINGLELIGNVWFNAGAAQTETGARKDDVIIAASNNVEAVVLRENMGWTRDPDNRSVAVGRYWNQNEDVSLVDNYLVGMTTFDAVWQSIWMDGNSFYELYNDELMSQHPDNTFFTDRPIEAEVFVRPNFYQPGRAHIIVYNWPLLDEVPVDLGGFLNQGDVYEVRNAQNYFAPPVVTGTYDGLAADLPMIGMEPVQPIGPGLIEPSEYTGKEFNVFVLTVTDHSKYEVAVQQGIEGIVAPGQTISYSIMITNTGELTDTYELSLGASQWLASVAPVSITLGPGESAPATVRVTAPVTVLSPESDSAVLHVRSRINSGDLATSTITTVRVGSIYRVYLPLIAAH